MQSGITGLEIVAGDLTEPGSPDRIVSEAVKLLGGLTTVVNCEFDFSNFICSFFDF